MSTTSTKHFKTYDAALAFATKQGINAYSKPWRQLIWLSGAQVPIWSVTLAGTPAAANSENVKLALAH